MTQDVDIQLQVWKDLAISKQILMGAATDALGLDAECSTDELKEALSKAIQRAKDADINIQETRSQADTQIAEYKKQADPSDLFNPGKLSRTVRHDSIYTPSLNLLKKEALIIEAVDLEGLTTVNPFKV